MYRDLQYVDKTIVVVIVVVVDHDNDVLVVIVTVRSEKFWLPVIRR